MSSMLRKEINSVFQTGIDIEKDKVSKIFRFSLFLVNFCQNIDGLCGLEC